jgi:alkylation response protein AidB-like acyl-CoA dehydrogenase
MQILGGYGYSKDMPVEALFRATRLWQIAEGSSEIQRLLIWRALDSGWSPRLDVGAE